MSQVTTVAIKTKCLHDYSSYLTSDGGVGMGKGGRSGKSGGKSTPMSKSAASRIQSHSAKTGKNQDFARRAQSSADKGSEK